MALFDASDSTLAPPQNTNRARRNNFVSVNNSAEVNPPNTPDIVNPGSNVNVSMNAPKTPKPTPANTRPTADDGESPPEPTSVDRGAPQAGAGGAGMLKSTNTTPQSAPTPTTPSVAPEAKTTTPAAPPTATTPEASSGSTPTPAYAGVKVEENKIGYKKGTARVDCSAGKNRVPGKGDGKTDTVKAMLAPGEAVLNRAAAEKLGRGMIKRLNEHGQRKMGMV